MWLGMVKGEGRKLYTCIVTVHFVRANRLVQGCSRQQVDLDDLFPNEQRNNLFLSFKAKEGQLSNMTRERD